MGADTPTAGAMPAPQNEYLSYHHSVVVAIYEMSGFTAASDKCEYAAALSFRHAYQALVASIAGPGLLWLGSVPERSLHIGCPRCGVRLSPHLRSPSERNQEHIDGNSASMRSGLKVGAALAGRHAATDGVGDPTFKNASAFLVLSVLGPLPR